MVVEDVMNTAFWYLAGPMRGLPRYNFDAFFDAEHNLINKRYIIVSPARHDIEIGLDPDLPLDEQGWDLSESMIWDIKTIMHPNCVGVIVLPGWERSSGVATELSVARTLKKQVLSYPKLLGLLNIPVTAEAQQLVYGARLSGYGHPKDNFEQTGKIWGALLGIDPIPAHMVGLCMAALKLSRETFSHKRDNLVDICGYAETVDMCYEPET